MAMPTGDSPQIVAQYYHYLQSRQLEPHGRTSTWHVDWTAKIGRASCRERVFAVV